MGVPIPENGLFQRQMCYLQMYDICRQTQIAAIQVCVL